jgi:hypothetical protein
LVGKPERRDHSEDLSVNEKDNIRMDVEEMSGKVWTGFIWLRIGTSGGLL